MLSGIAEGFQLGTTETFLSSYSAGATMGATVVLSAAGAAIITSAGTEVMNKGAAKAHGA
jgi:hypothetical protein